MATNRESLRRLLALYREGRIGDEELLARLDPEARAEGRAACSTTGGDPAELVRVLDEYRAAEKSGAATIAAWAELTADLELRGALRVLAAREAAHAQLLENRLRELGGEPRAVIPDWLNHYNEELLDRTRSDVERLGLIVARLPDVAAATAALRVLVDRIQDDELTRELIRTIAEDEELTLRWFHEAWVRRTGKP